MAGVKVCPGEGKALVFEKHSRKNPSEQKMRRELSLKNGWRPEVEAAQSEEPGTRWEQSLPCMAGGLQQVLLCTPSQGDLERRADESCPFQGTSPHGCRRQEAQAAARSPWGQEGWAGQARVALAAHSLPWPPSDPTPGFLPYPHPRIPPPSSAPGCLWPWDHTIGSERNKNPGEKGKSLYGCKSEVRSRTSSSSFRQSLQAENQRSGSWW